MRWRAMIYFKNDEEVVALWRNTPGEAAQDVVPLIEQANDDEPCALEDIQFIQIEPEEN